jgi:enamine deaminase RidA (YjgF/YER057c/UK114 family)
VGLQILATAQQALGSLDRITKTVKVLGMVNSAPEFEGHPKVINGCSDVLVEVLGEAGRHTRSAVGFAALPNAICVEIEATFEVE